MIFLASGYRPERVFRMFGFLLLAERKISLLLKMSAHETLYIQNLDDKIRKHDLKQLL